MMNFITAFYDDKGKLIYKFKGIAKNYLKGDFLIDLLTVFPLDIIFSDIQSYNKLFRLLRLPRIFKLKKTIKITKDNQESILVNISEYLN